MTSPEYELLAAQHRTLPDLSHTHIRLIRESEASGETAAVYQQFRDTAGRTDVPGILQCFGINPPLLRHFIGLSSSLLFTDGFLPRRQKELIATWISYQNACPYCLDSHAFFLRVHGGAASTVERLAAGDLAGADISQAERLLLTYLARVERVSFRLTREDVETLLAAGWAEEQVAEAVHVATVMGLCNRIANAFGLPSQHLLDLAPQE